MKGEEEGTVSRRRDEDVCKISVDDTYEGVSFCLSIFIVRGSVEHFALTYLFVVCDDPDTRTWGLIKIS